MKPRITALLLAGALTISLAGAGALAAQEDAPAPDSSQSQDSQPQDGQPQDGQSGEEEQQAAPGETPAPSEAPQDEEEDRPSQPEAPDSPGYVPDPLGSISFENLERRLRENDLDLLALEEAVQAIQVLDYDEMYEDLRLTLNSIASAQWKLVVYGMGDTPEAKALKTQYDALREQFDAIKEGELQEDNQEAIWQLRTAQDQVVMVGQSLYIALTELEQTAAALDRSLAALDRTLTELELRYQLGQISSQALKQAQAERTALVSSRQTLASNIKTYKLQLEMMLGAELTGTIRLGPLPQVTAKELEEMELEKDLAAAKEASYQLYMLHYDLEDAEKQYKSGIGRAYYKEDSYEYQAAQHQWNAAQHTYNAKFQNFEMSFRTLYLQVKDLKQVLDSAQTALAVAQDSYATAQLKHQQGALSANGLLDAEDKLKEAQEKVDGAANDLFSTYQSYRWAVDRGILN